MILVRPWNGRRRKQKGVSTASQEAVIWVQLASLLEWASPRNKAARREVMLGMWHHLGETCRETWKHHSAHPHSLTDDGVLMGCLCTRCELFSSGQVSVRLLCLCVPCQDKNPRSGHTLLLLTAALQSALFFQQKAVFTHTHSHLAFSN